MITLGQCADILRCQWPRNAGQPGSPPPGGKMLCEELRPGFDRYSGFVDLDYAQPVFVDGGGDGKYFIRQNDTLLIFSGRHDKLGMCGLVVDPVEKPTITSTSLCIVRPRDIDPIWLFHFLRQAPLQALALGRESAATRAISLEELRQMKIKRPSQEELRQVLDLHQNVLAASRILEEAREKLSAQNRSIRSVVKGEKPEEPAGIRPAAPPQALSLMDVLARLRSESLSEAEKGARFERLMAAWLKADPVYGSLLDEVWLWRDFPAREELGSADLGIDIVARAREGQYWAIQCKFHGDETVVDKNAVDSFISNSSRSFKDPINGRQVEFDARMWISTNDRFNANAAQIILHQQKPFMRVTLATLLASAVDWGALYHGQPEKRRRKTPQKHQETARDKALAHFQNHDRGKLIMACGTGKTYTSLLVAEKLAAPRGSVLVLVPSISLLNQMLNSWMADRSVNIKPLCICSDPAASRGRGEDGESLADLALPATTNPEEIARRWLAHAEALEQDGGLLVVFSTYQSIDAVAAAQKAVSRAMGRQHVFDMAICDEAHRTTGIIRPGEGKSEFTRVHDEDFIHAAKRLYMTATPRLYTDNVKAKAALNDYELCSMDDVSIYGEEIDHVGFGYAVANNLLTDYKVIVLTVGSEYQLPPEIRAEVQNADNKELNFDLASRLVGCINGLAKNTPDNENAQLWLADPRVMKRAIAFCPNIAKKGDPASSKNTAMRLPQISAGLLAAPDSGPRHRISIHADHVDGGMDAAQRAAKLSWLSQEDMPEGECRVLCNVRCLSEGIDVPALDAAIFLSPRNSQVDVVQSVGRVMRNFHKGRGDEKKFGYIIIPVVVNPHVPPEEALNDNKSFAVVWSILNALRAHDERFNAMINSIALNRAIPDQIVVNHTDFYAAAPEGDTDYLDEREAAYARDLQQGMARQLSLLRDMRDAIYAKMVEKVGSRVYWERWARDMAPLARNLIGRIAELVAPPGELRDSFDQFVASLRAAINDSVTPEKAMKMLGQHLITRPVFEALFKEYAFDSNNPVSRSMKQMTDELRAHGLDKDTAVLNRFYESVKLNLGVINTLSGKQTVIKNLYDSFFSTAFPKAVEQLGIVYTPVECVDFILRSVNDVLLKEFGMGLTDRGVHILDPFTGTGTFITRLLQSGLIKKEDLERKYMSEIHCNEIMLLPYYVADINIESTYQALARPKNYMRFDGICLTDTFELSGTVEQQPELYPPMRDNLRYMATQQKAPIRVIVGNPPYSAGQKSGNDNAQNRKYPALDKRLEETYVQEAGDITNRNSLYDSYIRAFRWATDRLKKDNQGGVIGFITNGGWLDGNAAAGMRKCLEREFTSIYVFHLRGDQRTSGELSRKEGGKIFGSGSRAPVVITILVYNPDKHGQKAAIHYCDIGDYLSRQQKLDILAERKSIFDKKMDWTLLQPDEHGDWLRQRSDLFGDLIPLGDKKNKKEDMTFFLPVYSRGLETARDAWVYNFSRKALEENIKKTIDFYNAQCVQAQNNGKISMDPTGFSWTEPTRNKVLKNIRFNYNRGIVMPSMYRPFCREYVYFSPELNHRPGNWPAIFPTAKTENRVICLNGSGGKKDFSCLMTNVLPDLEIIEKSQCFPLYYYRERQQGDLLGGDGGYERRDAITDWVLENVRTRFDKASFINKETIFYYVYGLLHSADYRARFADDLKKSLPRLPIAEPLDNFMAFAEAGRKLAALHLDYALTPPCPDVILAGLEHNDFQVEKMRFGGKAGAWDKTRIIYNSHVEIRGIPIRAHEYVINGRSAVEWIMESYRMRTDRDSGIVNDPNAWGKEHGNPRYILDLLLSVINLSLQTLDIARSLPELDFGGDLVLQLQF